MGDCDILLCDRTIEPLSPRRTYFLGWPMTRAELVERLETEPRPFPKAPPSSSRATDCMTSPIPSVVATRRCCRCWPMPRTPRSGRGLVDLACVGGAGDNVAVGLVEAGALARRRSNIH